MIISQMLKGKRKEFQLTQEQLAEKIFVSTKTISNWETGKTKPDIESLILLAKLFDLSLDNLLLEGSDMVKSIDKDIRKGRNLKKIVFIAAFPMMAIIIILLWVNYKGNNMTIVPLNELSNIELSTSDLTNTTNIEADIKLKQFESYHFVDTIIEDNTVYLMVYKRPKLFSSSSHFSISLTESIEEYHLSTKDINKIVVTYLDVKKSNGFTREELVNDLPKKVVWERNNSQLDY